MKSWYYKNNDKQMGPVSFEELRKLSRVKAVNPNTMVKEASTIEWIAAWKVEGLFPKTKAAQESMRPQQVSSKTTVIDCVVPEMSDIIWWAVVALFIVMEISSFVAMIMLDNVLGVILFVLGTLINFIYLMFARAAIEIVVLLFKIEKNTRKENVSG